MKTIDDEDRWPKAGRLDEHDPDIFRLKARPAHRAGHLISMFRRWPVSGRKTAPCRPNSPVAVRIAATIPTLANQTRLAPYHLSVTYHSRDRARWTQPLSCRLGRRVAVFPRTSDELQKVRKAGGKYVKKCRVWTVKSDNKLLRTPQGEYLASDVAALKREGRRAGKSVARSERRAIDFIRYIERLNRNEEVQIRDLDSDDEGLISFGTLGRTPALRQMHVEAVLDVERRHDARIQSRIIAELPHWISAADRRLIGQKFSKIFEERGLGYWVAVHRPDADGDQRNFHLHIVYHDRPVIENRVDFLPQLDGTMVAVQKEPLFATNKDRSASGPIWIKFLRESYAEVVNEVLLARAEREQQAPPYLFFPGSYRDLGIETTPEIHLGPRQSALVRKGNITWREFHNLETKSEIFVQRERAATTKFETAHNQLKERITSNGHDANDVVAILNAGSDDYAHTLEGLAAIQEFQTEAPTTEAIINFLEVHQLDETRLRSFISSVKPEDDNETLLNLAYICLLHRLEVTAAYYDAISLGENLLSTEDQLISSEIVGEPIFISACDAAIARTLGARQPSVGQGWLIRPEINDVAKERLVRLFCSPEAKLYAFVDRRVPRDAELAIETLGHDVLLKSSGVDGKKTDVPACDLLEQGAQDERSATIESNMGGCPLQADQSQNHTDDAPGLDTAIRHERHPPLRQLVFDRQVLERMAVGADDDYVSARLRNLKASRQPREFIIVPRQDRAKAIEMGACVDRATGFFFVPTELAQVARSRIVAIWNMHSEVSKTREYIDVPPSNAVTAVQYGARFDALAECWFIAADASLEVASALRAAFATQAAAVETERQQNLRREMVAMQFLVGANELERSGEPMAPTRFEFERLMTLSGAAASGGTAAIKPSVPTSSKAASAVGGNAFKPTREAVTRESGKARWMREKGAAIYGHQPAVSARSPADQPVSVLTKRAPLDSSAPTGLNDRASLAAAKYVDAQMPAAALVFEPRSSKPADIVDLRKRANGLSSSMLPVAHRRTSEAYENAKAVVRQYPGAATIEKMLDYKTGLEIILEVARERGIELLLTDSPQTEATADAMRAKSARNQGR